MASRTCPVSVHRASKPLHSSPRSVPNPRVARTSLQPGSMHAFRHLVSCGLGFLLVGGCAMEVRSVYAINPDDTLGSDGDTNVVRIAEGSRHFVRGSFGERGLVTIDVVAEVITSAAPAVVRVTPADDDTWLLEGVSPGETRIVLQAGDDDASVPVVVVPTTADQRTSTRRSSMR
jgi:hypothetical protein